MKHRFYLGLSSLLFLLVLSTSGTYALTESFDIVANGSPAFHELDFLEKDNSFVDLNIEVLEAELGNCSLFVIDNYQRDQLFAIWDYIAVNHVYPWSVTDPPGIHGPTGLAYADLEPIEVYFGASNLTLGSKKTITGYLGPLSADVYSTYTNPYDPNDTIVSTEQRDYTYYVVLESSIAITAYNPVNPLYPLILGINYYYAKVFVKFVSTLPAPSALVVIVVLS
ncbi:MAG: hypothetical protein ACTSSH_05585, partial [Candidatus Heimdallarchaeota archaeon]